MERDSRVLIKPNFVTDRYYHERLVDKSLLASSTHASVIRPLVDFALERGAAEILVADTPIEGCDLQSVTRGLGFDAMVSALQARGKPIRFLDLRPFRLVPKMLIDDIRMLGRSWNFGALMRQDLAGDPEGYEVVDLAETSRFDEVEHRAERLRFHRANPTIPVGHHSGGKHEYGIPRSVLNADLIIHVPKLKTHKKSGITMALKSSIGLCGYKYWLPHYTEGVPEEGDEFPSQPRMAERIAMKLSRLPMPRGHSAVLRAPPVNTRPPITEGSWEGNDTIWRTTLDLARIHTHAARDGVVGSEQARGTFTVIDGIVAGEGEGPFGVTPVPIGLLIAGEDPVLVDAVGSKAMGFDWRRIPTIARAFERPFLSTSRIDGLDTRWEGPPADRIFQAPRAWPSLNGGPDNQARSFPDEEWAG